jgi:hypothetical protein
MYEDLLYFWFKNIWSKKGYKVYGKDVRKGLYKGKRVAVDFILERDGRLYAVEAKCWPAYLEGRLKRLTLKNIERVKREFKTPFLEEDFVSEYRIGERSIDGKILVWWDVEAAEAGSIKDELNLEGLISIKQILHDMKGEADFVEKYKGVVEKYKTWANQFFEVILE